MLADQVCEWIRSTLLEAAVIDRHTDKVASAQLAGEVVDVDPGAAVDVRREFSGRDGGMHVGDLSGRSGTR